jgi:hypothetical protein
MGLNKWVAPRPMFHRTLVTSVALRNADGVGDERTETTEDNVMRQLRLHTKVRAAALILLTAAFFAGCGGGSSTSQMTPSTQNAIVAGQYNLVLTSAGGHDTTSIYANFTQTGATFTGNANTLVCPSNDPSQCKQDSVTSNGTVSGSDVTIVVSFPGQTGTTTVNMVGSATGTGALNGNYTDSLGDAGTWTASTETSIIEPGSVIDYTGTFNSTSNPLSISPSITVALGPGASPQTNLSLTGSASVMNWPCVTSLTLSGQMIGDAFSVTDAVSKVDIIVLPNLPSGNSFNFSYKFEPTAASCPGDYGRGVLTVNSVPDPWGY